MQIGRMSLGVQKKRRRGQHCLEHGRYEGDGLDLLVASPPGVGVLCTAKQSLLDAGT